MGWFGHGSGWRWCCHLLELACSSTLPLSSSCSRAGSISLLKMWHSAAAGSKSAALFACKIHQQQLQLLLSSAAGHLASSNVSLVAPKGCFIWDVAGAAPAVCAGTPCCLMACFSQALCCTRMSNNGSPAEGCLWCSCRGSPGAVPAASTAMHTSNGGTQSGVGPPARKACTAPAGPVPAAGGHHHRPA